MGASVRGLFGVREMLWHRGEGACVTNFLRRFGPLALLVPAGLFVLAAAQPHADIQVELAFAGKAGRFAFARHGVSLDDATRALAFDSLFVVSWLVVVPYLVFRGCDLWAPPYRQGRFWP